jgi:hypothetical protein
MGADHHWWMFPFHDWNVKAVEHRFKPWFDPFTRKIDPMAGTKYTDVLYACACGKTKVKSIKGTWTLEQLK